MEMKETKKSILKVLKKDGKKKASKFDRMVLLLTSSLKKHVFYN